jgi:F-type H+-transporting ATPase subunit delta
MHAASRAALAELRERVDDASVSADHLTQLADELYAVTDALVSQPRLRRTLGDPATAPQARVGLVATLFEGKVATRTLEVVQAAVEQRWSSPWDLTDGLELTADDSLLGAAEKRGELAEVEDELFRFERVLAVESRLTTLLDEMSVAPERRVRLLHNVLDGKVTPVTLALLEHAVASTRRRSIEAAIDDLLEAAAARQSRSVARVISAVPLTDAQESRLSSVLERMYGRPIAIRSAVEPAVQGGLVIRVGDEVIDGSVASRFAAARKALAG